MKVSSQQIKCLQNLSPYPTPPSSTCAIIEYASKTPWITVQALGTRLGNFNSHFTFYSFLFLLCCLFLGFSDKGKILVSMHYKKKLPFISCTCVKTHSFVLPVDRLEHGWIGQFEHGWAGQLEHSWVGQLEHGWTDQLEHGWAGQLEHDCWQACSCMLKQTVHGLMNEQTWTTLLE